MEELINDLKSITSKLEEIIDMSKRGGYTTENILNKKIEDGILDNIHKANPHQLNLISNSYRFRFYTEYNSNRQLLINEIQRRLRDKKLDQILKNN